MFNHGHHKRDFTFVDDIAEGVVRACDRIATPNADWTGNNPDPATSSAPFRHLQHRQQRAGRSDRATSKCSRTASDARPSRTCCRCSRATCPDTFADVEDLVRDVGYKPATPVEVGIRRFVDWYLEYYKTHAPQRPRASPTSVDRSMTRVECAP